MNHPYSLKRKPMKRFTALSLLVILVQIAMAQVTVNITVKSTSDYSTPVSGATVTLNGTSAVTDANGLAVITVPSTDQDEYLSYTVTAPGFIDFSSDYLYIPGGATEATNTTYIQPAYSITFTITNKESQPIAGAQVVVGDQSGTTDASGKLVIEKQFEGGWRSYEYTVSADGYADYSATVTVKYDDVVLDPIALQKAYDVTFTVKDASNAAIAGAVVSMNNASGATGDDGSVVFHKIIDGDFAFLVSHAGYVDVPGSLQVNGAAVVHPVTMNTGYNLTLTIINGQEGITGLANDTITIGNVIKTTNIDGQVTFGIDPGTLNFTVQKAGFIPSPVTTDITDQDVALTVYMKPDYAVAFSVVDEISYMPIANATISINGTQVQTDENGFATFRHLEPSAMDYEYSVSAEGGYNSVSGTVSLPVSSPYVEQFNLVNLPLNMIKPGVSIGLTDGWMSYFGGATVRVNGQDYTYDSGLGFVRIDILPGMYTFLIIPDDETKAILKETYEVGNTGYDNLFVNVADGYKAEIFAVDKNSDPIEGARVVLDGDTLYTDASGDAVFARKAAADYTYSVSKDGYQPVTGAALSVNTADVVEIATLQDPSWTLTLVVKDASGPVEGATVTIGTEAVTTNTEGKAVFPGKVAGSYTYEISREGYVTANGTADVSSADATYEVMITATGMKNTGTGVTAPWPNPTNGLIHMSMPEGSSSVSIEIINTRGQQVKEMNLPCNSSSPAIFDLSSLPSGTYFLRLTNIHTTQTWQIIKK